eukprot:jgi/Tetstr1/443259/TSEL_031293.t1
MGIAARREVDDLFQQAVPLGDTVPMDELHNMVSDAELFLPPAFNVVTESCDSRSLKSKLLEVKTMRTGRIVEDVRHALFRGYATNNHIRVYPKQPQGEDAFGYAFADIILNNCAERKQYDKAGEKLLLEPDMGTDVKNASADGPSHTLTTSRGLESTMKAKDKAALSDVFGDFWPRHTKTGLPYPLKQTPMGSQRRAPQQKRAGGIIKHNTNAVKNMAASQAVPGDNVDKGSSPEPPAKKAKQPAKPPAGVPARGRG